jgi:hypothetical protein
VARQGLVTVLLAKSTSTHCLLHLLPVLPSKGRRNGVASGPHPQGPQGPEGRAKNFLSQQLTTRTF